MAWHGVRPLSDGGYGVRLHPADRELLRTLAADVRELVEQRDGAVARLFPPAYRHDEEAEAEYERLVHDELAAGRVRALRTVEASASADRLDAAEADAWCGALNDLRLVLGERLGVTDELIEQELAPGDPRGPQVAVYLWLTWLQSTLVDALASRLPER
jgi:hypothetical protein